jgi:alpha-D-ribose 1-methylphosphonate 5-triphosphate synthase subunit PhnG
MTTDLDFVLVECDLARLQGLVERLETAHAVTVVRNPEACMVLLRAQDSLEGQEFFLGEALTTECEVTVDGAAGFGACLGDEPVRAYCLAVMDALRDRLPAEALDVIREEQQAIEERDRRDFDLTLRTKVDFKLLEQE